MQTSRPGLMDIETENRYGRIHFAMILISPCYSQFTTDLSFHDIHEIEVGSFSEFGETTRFLLEINSQVIFDCVEPTSIYICDCDYEVNRLKLEKYEVCVSTKTQIKKKFH